MDPECYELIVGTADGKEKHAYIENRIVACVYAFQELLADSVSVRIEPHDVWPSNVPKVSVRGTEEQETAG